MTPEELTAFGKARYEGYWVNQLAKELGFHCSTIWRAARGKKPVSREIEQAIKLLPKRKSKKQQETQPTKEGN